MQQEIMILCVWFVSTWYIGHSAQKDDQKLVFKTDYRLMQVKSIAECSNGSILQYFRSSLSYHLSLGSLSIFEWPLKTGFTVCIEYISS